MKNPGHVIGPGPHSLGDFHEHADNSAWTVPHAEDVRAPAPVQFHVGPYRRPRLVAAFVPPCVIFSISRHWHNPNKKAPNLWCSQTTNPGRFAAGLALVFSCWVALLAYLLLVLKILRHFNTHRVRPTVRHCPYSFGGISNRKTNHPSGIRILHESLTG